MVVHPREHELVIGTHGRSIWVMDVKPLHKLAERINEQVTGFSPEDIRYSNRWGSQFAPYREPFNPSVDLMYFVSNKNGDSVVISVKNKEGNKVFTTKQSAEYGFNVFEWDLVIDTDRDGNKSYIQKGEYTIEYKVGRSTHITSFNVK